MKKVLVSILVGILSVLILALSACGDDKSGTYYPTNEEMKTNLENSGYNVTVYQDLLDNSGNHHDGTLLSQAETTTTNKKNICISIG